ncbi:MAG: hypothetical protein RLP14_08355 [Owenweeksia sp.]
MDLTARKYKFIERFMKLTSLKKIKQLEEVLRDEVDDEEEIVAYAVTGEPLTRKQYLDDLKEAEAEIERGEFITHEELKEEVRTWGKR